MTSRAPIRRLGQITLGKMIQGNRSKPEQIEAPYFRAAHIQSFGRLAPAVEQQMWFQPQELREQALRTGDVIIVEGGAGFGRSAVIDVPPVGWGFQNSIVRVRPIAGRSDGRFLNYALQSANHSGEIESVCSTSTIPHFTADKVASFYLPAPAIGMQVMVADYLDRETAQIDALIEKQEQLIAALRERFVAKLEQAVEATTSPPMMVKRLLSRPITDGPHETPEFLDQGVPFLSVDGIQDGELDFESCRYISAEAHATYAQKITPQRGDVLMGKSASTGKIALVKTDREFNVWSPLAVLRPNPQLVTGEWLEWSLKSASVQAAIDMACTNNTQKNIAMPDIGRLRVGFPSLETQLRAVREISAAHRAHDLLISKAERFIALSRERRAALITAAVTGQLDVTERAA